MESPAVAAVIRATALTYGESVSEIMRRIIDHGLSPVQNELQKERPSIVPLMPPMPPLLAVSRARIAR
jgi:hypothetical protein